MQEDTLQGRVREGHLPSFRAYVRWSIYERDRTIVFERMVLRINHTLPNYNDVINYFKPQPYLCTGPLSKGMELIMQLRAGILPLNAMTAKFGRQSASRQNARRECCKSCDLGPKLGDEVESPDHFLFHCPVYQAQRQKLWEKLTSDPAVAAKCQRLVGKSDEEKLHSMLDEEFWGVAITEESGLVYGPSKHAVKCIARYVSAAWKVLGMLVHTFLKWREVQPMGLVTTYCLHLGLQALLVFLSRREALSPIGAVEVLGAFHLAAGPHV